MDDTEKNIVAFLAILKTKGKKTALKNFLTTRLAFSKIIL